MTNASSFHESALSIPEQARAHAWASSDACQFWFVYIVALPFCLVATVSLRLQRGGRSSSPSSSILQETCEMASAAISMAF